jgi:Xaa-Pro aminopeptidase
MNADRRARLLALMDARGLEALVGTTPANVAYVTGLRSPSHAVFRGAEYYAVLAPGGTGLVVPFIDTAAAAADDVACDVLACYGRFFFEHGESAGEVGRKVRDWTREPAPSPADGLARVLAELGVAGGRVGLDEANCFPQTWQRLEQRLGDHSLVPAYQLLREARMVKERGEVAALERAAQIAEAAIAAVCAMLGPGVTEREAVRAYETEVLRQGASPHITVVLFSERSALADVPPSDRALRRGDVVRFDGGGVYGGYCSDMSRTAVLGDPSPKLAAHYAALRAGEEAAIAAMKPGITAGQIFDTAVRTVRESGLPHYQRHHVGHGIGLELYDPPTIVPGSDAVLEPGMVFCVETPYYELGWTGLQVEDTVEIVPDGVRFLTRSSRELIVLA